MGARNAPRRGRAPGPESRDRRMARIVLEAVDAWRDGRPPDPQLFAERHPDLRVEIEERLETIAALEACRQGGPRRSGG